MKLCFIGAQDLFPTMHVLAALPGKNSRFALKQFSRRALRSGGMVPGKISKSPLMKHNFSGFVSFFIEV